VILTEITYFHGRLPQYKYRSEHDSNRTRADTNLPQQRVKDGTPGLFWSGHIRKIKSEKGDRKGDVKLKAAVKDVTRMKDSPCGS
jgi:hypothetical protein